VLDEPPRRDGDLWLLIVLLAVGLVAHLVAGSSAGSSTGSATRPTARPVLHRHRVAIDEATEAELLSIPGVGPVLAAAIVEERERGPFEVVTDLQRVRGIGPRIASRIARYTTLGATPRTAEGAAGVERPSADPARRALAPSSGGVTLAPSPHGSPPPPPPEPLPEPRTDEQPP
jgi:competence protein ComEA